MRTIARANALALTLAAGLAAPAIANGDLPLTNLTLYRSGVGAFTHTASIEGSTSFDLTFSTKNVDDVLKSLLLLDAVQGGNASASYQSSEDLARRLSRFSIDLSQSSSIQNLFAQLRGSEVTLEVFNEQVSGTILGVEKRPVSVGTSESTHASSRDFVNIITESGIRSIRISTIQSFNFTDPDLSKELNAALSTLASSRNDNIRDMSINFDHSSAQRRPVAVSYVHEMPVWKSAYRFVIPRTNDLADEGKLTLQAWAIIENTTAQDWNTISLSLASGSPVTFTMNLDEALYTNRPSLPVPVAANALASANIAQQLHRQSVQAMKSAGAPIESRFAFADASGASPEMEELSLNTMTSSQSTAEQIGGQFLFSLDAPLTLKSQQSAMLPIASTTITGEPTSFYNFNANPEHPVMGIRFTNDTGLHLMPGPVTVYDAGTYAGDANLDHTARDRDQRLTYALDLDVDAARTQKSTAYDIAYQVEEGLLKRVTRREITWVYTFDNASPNERTLVLDHTKHFGFGGTIINPETPKENSIPTITRELTVPAAGKASVKITERSDSHTTYRLIDQDIENILAFIRTDAAPQGLIEELKSIAKARTKINAIERDIEEVDRQLRVLTQDQSRIRQNMRDLDRNSDLYKRFYTRLGEQETTFDTLNAKRATLTNQLDAARDTLRDFLANLTIE